MKDARIVLVGQVHELIDQIERTTYLFRSDDEGRKQAEGCVAHARKVSAPFNYNGPSIEWQELADAQAEIARLRGALTTIIDLNVQYCEDRYGDKSKAESMACVRIAREALK